MVSDELVERLRSHLRFVKLPAWVRSDLPLAANEIERLNAEVRRLDYSSIHTCWDECPRLPCAQRREIEHLTAQLAEARESERAAVVAWLRGLHWTHAHNQEALFFAAAIEDKVHLT